MLRPNENYQFEEISEPFPAEFAAQLATLYHSSNASLIKFLIYKKDDPVNALIIKDKLGSLHQLIFFSINGEKILILNEMVEIEGGYISLIEEYFFQRSRIRAIQFTNVLTTRRSKRPCTVVERNDIFIINLPDTTEQYRALLSRSTRKNIQSSLNRLDKDHGPYCFEVMAKGEIKAEHIHYIIELKNSRMTRQGRTSALSRKDADKLTEMAASMGLAGILSVQGKTVAMAFCYLQGASVDAHIIVHDEAFNDYSPGLVCNYLMVLYCVEHGFRSYNLLWGAYGFKTSLRAEPKPYMVFVVYKNYWYKIMDLAVIFQSMRKRARSNMEKLLKRLGLFVFLKRMKGRYGR